MRVHLCFIFAVYLLEVGFAETALFPAHPISVSKVDEVSIVYCNCHRYLMMVTSPIVETIKDSIIEMLYSLLFLNMA